MLYDNFDLIDAVAPYEVLVAGSLVGAGEELEFEFASAEGPRSVPSAPTGAPMQATAKIDLERADAIMIPGVAGELVGDDIPKRLAAALETPLREVLEEAVADPSVTVYTVCGGALLLGMAGLLEGRHAVTHHMGMEVLEATGVIAVDARIVDDGDVISSGSVTSGLDLGLYLLEREFGPRIAASVESVMSYQRRGTVWFARGLEPIL